MLYETHCVGLLTPSSEPESDMARCRRHILLYRPSDACQIHEGKAPTACPVRRLLVVSSLVRKANVTLHQDTILFYVIRGCAHSALPPFSLAEFCGTKRLMGYGGPERFLAAQVVLCCLDGTLHEHGFSV